LYDASEGNITTAKVRFVVRDFNTLAPIANGTTPWLSPTVITAGDNKTGSVNYDLSISTGSQDYALYVVSIEIGENGNYTGGEMSAGALTVAKPLGDFVTGGGNITPGVGQSRGIYASDAGRKTNFGFNVKYTKSSTTLQGNLNIIFRRTVNGVVRTYQIKSTAFNSGGNSFGVGNNPGDPTTTLRSVLVTKANLIDVTNSSLPVSIAGNLTLQLDMTDRGEPGTSDDMGISLWNGSELWYSSNWSGTKTLPLILTGGNIVIRGGAYGSLIPTTTTATATATRIIQPALVVAGESKMSVYPNPSKGMFTVALESYKTGKATIEVTTENGAVVSRKVISLLSNEAMTTFDLPGLAAGVYLVKVSTEQGMKVSRVVIQK
jgi:hypothetical protein